MMIHLLIAFILYPIMCVVARAPPRGHVADANRRNTALCGWARSSTSTRRNARSWPQGRAMTPCKPLLHGCTCAARARNGECTHDSSMQPALPDPRPTTDRPGVLLSHREGHTATGTPHLRTQRAVLRLHSVGALPPLLAPAQESASMTFARKLIISAVLAGCVFAAAHVARRLGVLEGGAAAEELLWGAGQHTMPAAVLHGHGPPEAFELELIPKPTVLGSHEVLVRVKAASVNPIDAKLRYAAAACAQAPATMPCATNHSRVTPYSHVACRSGNLAAVMTVEFPAVLGIDFAGVVERVGSRVASSSAVRPGVSHAWYMPCIRRVSDPVRGTADRSSASSTGPPRRIVSLAVKRILAAAARTLATCASQWRMCGSPRTGSHMTPLRRRPRWALRRGRRW